MAVSALPDLDQLNDEALKVLLVERHREHVEFAAQRQRLSAQSDELHTRSEQIEHLKLLVEKLRRTIFGRKSEKVVVQLEQLELELEELETAQSAAEATADASRSEAAPASRPRRKPLPEHLRREAVTHAPEHTCCPDCGGALKQFGEDVSEQLEYVPESFKVIRHVRPKFACAAASAWWRLRRLRGLSNADWPVRRCWRMCWFLSIVITNLSIVSRRSMRGRASRSSAPRWLAGWAHPAHYSILWSMPCASIFWRDAKSTPTIPPCPCWLRERARPKPAACGLMCATSVRPERRLRRPCGLLTRKIARASIRAST